MQGVAGRPEPPVLPGQRDVALDGARAVLMLLGIVLHVTAPYAPRSEWVLQDAQTSSALDWLFHGIHLFRLPAFFWISGYFFAMTMRRRNPSTVLRRRMTRLLVPLFVTWITFNVLQELALALVRHRDPLASVLDGVPVGHLWFLVDLAIISILASLPLLFAGGLARRAMGRVPDTLGVPLLIALLTLGETMSVVAARATGVGYVSLGGVTTLARIATYFPYFAAGVVMYCVPGIRHAFLRIPPALALVALPVGTFAATWRRVNDGMLAELAAPLEYFMVWICVGVVLQLFYRAIRRETRLVRVVCDSSYSVYLIHHLIVVLVTVALLPSGLGLPAKLAIGMVVTFALATGIHFAWVAPSPLLQFLLNGKGPRRPDARRTEAGAWGAGELNSPVESSAS